MPFLSVGQENSGDVELYFEDHGVGQPVVLIHGYPQSGAAWEKQTLALLEAGYRVITYDRRGFGKSSQPTFGYNYDTFASDLNELMTKLDLRETILIGHSMGTGEICRYLSRFGSERVARSVFISGLQPFLLQSDQNPEGVPMEQIEAFEAKAKEDRFSFLSTFFKAFYSSGMLQTNGVSAETIQYNQMVGSLASAKAIQACIRTWVTDFTADLSAVKVPSLILHGTSDKVVPFNATAPKMHEMIAGSRLVPIEGAPHSLPWTHAEAVNREILDFLSASSRMGAVA